jgi:hypothetical protein
MPINYELKSNLEKEAIINSYKLFLKTCDFDIQILIQSRKENFNSYISQIKNQIIIEKNSYIEQVSNIYINHILYLNKLENSSSKNFFILFSFQKDNENEFSTSQVRDILNDNFNKIKDTLSRCGNTVFEINSRRETEKILYSFYNFRKSLKLI